VEGKWLGRVFSYRDITERCQAEVKTRRYASRLKALADVSRLFAEARLDVPAVLQVAVRQVAELFQGGALVHLCADGQPRLKVVAQHHSDPAVLGLMGKLQENVFLDERITRELVDLGGAARVIAPTPWSLQEQAWLVVPLRVAGRVTGSLTVIRDKPDVAYSADDETFLQELADRAAVSIDNAQLFADAQSAIQLREDFISIASHELKTPLTPLKLQLQLLTAYIQSGALVVTPKARNLPSLIAKSDQQIDRITRLVEDMLDASRLRTGRFTLQQEPVCLRTLVTDVIDRYRPQLDSAHCPVQLEGETQVWGKWDRLRIEQLVTNLLSNAMKYGAGKSIEVKITRKEGSCVLSVRDHGIGIAPKDHCRVFQRFGRAVSAVHFGGMGLGLYIARQIVEAHGGRITFESGVDEGALFTVELPIEQQMVS
jgi:signal transduction histidine kinase